MELSRIDLRMGLAKIATANILCVNSKKPDEVYTESLSTCIFIQDKMN